MASRLMVTSPGARRRWRGLLGGVLAAGLAIATPIPHRAEAVATAVDWQVDPATRTIIVTVNIAVWAQPAPASGEQEQIVQDAIKRIKAGILAEWDGKKFKCYTLSVNLKVRRVIRSGEVAAGEVPVVLDAGIYPLKESSKLGIFRSNVAPKKNYDRKTYLSDDHQFDPSTGPSGRASRWALTDSAEAYAHEFGHILGLTDTYVEGKGTVKPGAVRDLMTTLSATVDPMTVVKAVRRSGKVDESTIKCPVRIDMARAYAGLPGFAALQLEVHGCAPDYTPGSTDPSRPGSVDFHGTVSVGGDYLSAFPILGGAKDSGRMGFVTTWRQGEPEVVIDLPGNSISQEVVTTGGGPLALPVGAQLRNGGGTLRLSETMTIVPYEGPCT